MRIPIKGCVVKGKVKSVTIAVDTEASKSEVRQLDIPMSGEEDIFTLEVSVGNVHGVEVVEPTHHLSEPNLGLSFWDESILSNKI